MSDKEADLLRPEAYPPPYPSRLECRTTHISWVFLSEHDAYKVKRPVNFGFLDFTSCEKRRAACEAEVTLNRRLAPNTYLGVVPVFADAHGRLQFAPPTAQIVDWAVHMRRLPDNGRADTLCDANLLSLEHMDRLAARLAQFHAAARRADDVNHFGTVEALTLNVEENFEQAAGDIARFITTTQAEEVTRWQLDFLREHEALINARIKHGHICEGHGDLRLEHVYFGPNDTIHVLDCIEFNQRFRCGDVCSDIAFLAMDLAWHEQVPLAERLLARYALEANDYGLYRLVDFYESYRAYVRGKIACFITHDLSLSREHQITAAQQARSYFLLALGATRKPLAPSRLIAVGGLIASGKSTIAEQLARAIAAPIVEADRTRKSMLGIAPTDSAGGQAWHGAYNASMTERVYHELLNRADAVLSSHRTVIIDASFRSASFRSAARALATRHNIPFHFIECRSSDEVCKKRLVARAQHNSVSDARIELFDTFKSQYEPVTELCESEYIVLNTTFALRDSMNTLQRWLEDLHDP